MSSDASQERSQQPKQKYLTTFGVGVAMGAADIVPGVSGGTVALILGVYERLLGALSSFNRNLINDLVSGRLADAWRRIDGTFLVALGAGVLIGAKGLAGVVTYLLSEQMTYTYAVFFGLILASGLLVARMSRPTSTVAAAKAIAYGLVAAAFAVWLMSQGRLVPIEGLLYTFFCGAIAICAMILPGISGAYLLLILGKYETITEIIHQAPGLSAKEFITLGVFAAGCLTGLLLFSRLLKWLLARYWTSTMAVLSGFMIGSLYRVWPFQVDTTPEVEEFKLKVFEPIVPAEINSTVWVCLLLTVGSFLLVLMVDAVSRRLSGELAVEADASVASDT